MGLLTFTGSDRPETASNGTRNPDIILLEGGISFDELFTDHIGSVQLTRHTALLSLNRRE